MADERMGLEVLGTGASQIAEVCLSPGGKLIAAPGAMTYMDIGVDMQAKFGDKSKGRHVWKKLFSFFKKAVTKSSLTIIHFENKSGVDQRAGFSSTLPGQLVEVDLSDWPEGIICQKNAFILASDGTRVEAAVTGVAAGSFGGAGFVLQKLVGDGIGVFCAGGSIVAKSIENSSITVETRSIAAYSANLSYSVTRTGNISTTMFAKEGLFNSTLTGTGTVFIQSLPTEKLEKALENVRPKKGKKEK